MAVALSSFIPRVRLNNARTLKTNLVAHWGLEEASGNRLDDFGNNTSTSNNSVGTAAGKIGQAAQFVAASSQYLSIADNAALSMGVGVRFSFALWVKLNTVSAVRTLLSKRAGGGNLEYWIRYSNSSNRFEFTVSPNGTSTTTVTANVFGAPSTATWYLIITKYDGTNISLSVNAGTPDTAAFSADVVDGSQTFRIGAGNNSEYMDGAVDEIALWKRALSAGEETVLYNGGSGLAYSNFGNSY